MDLREIAAQKFGTTPDKVSNEQVAAIQAIVDEVAAKSLPTQDEGLAHTKAIETMQAQLEEEKQARIDFQRQVAEWKDKPHVDPDSERIALDRLSRAKSLPEMEILVKEPAQDETEAAALTIWDNLHTLSVVMHNRRTRTTKPARDLSYFERVKTLAPTFAKALDTATAQEGADWAPTEYSSQLIDAIFDDTIIDQICTRFTMTRSPLNLPFSMTGGTCYLAGEAAGDDVAEYTASTGRTDDITFTAAKLAMLMNFSDEIDEESLVPIIPQVQFTIRRTLAEGIEDAIFDGDTTTTHQDSDVTSSADRRKAWDGLRDWLIANTTAWKSFATFDGDNAINAVCAAMTQKYLPGAKWVFPMKKRYDVITIVDDSTNKNPLILRSTGLGDSAITSGNSPDLLGNPILFSSRMRTTLNASGVYDGSTTTKTWAVLVNPRAWWLGDRRDVRLEVDREIAKGRSRIVGTWRGSFECVIPSGLSEVHTGGGYNY